MDESLVNGMDAHVAEAISALESGGATRYYDCEPGKRDSDSMKSTRGALKAAGYVLGSLISLPATIGYVLGKENKSLSYAVGFGLMASGISSVVTSDIVDGILDKRSSVIFEEPYVAVEAQRPASSAVAFSPIAAIVYAASGSTTNTVWRDAEDGIESIVHGEDAIAHTSEGTYRFFPTEEVEFTHDGKRYDMGELQGNLNRLEEQAQVIATNMNQHNEAGELALARGYREKLNLVQTEIDLAEAEYELGEDAYREMRGRFNAATARMNQEAEEMRLLGEEARRESENID